MKIVTVLGARPQFIKAMPVSRALQQQGIDQIIIHTGQHFDANMSQTFFDQLALPKPDYHLGINQLSHYAMVGRMLEKIGDILSVEKPDWVLLFGDTHSTLAGALAAKKCQLPIAHIEAGLRNHDLSIPEEVNRILTDRISRLLFCPTEVAVNNLLAEGFADFPCQIHQVGDVMVDAVEQTLAKIHLEATLSDYGLVKGHYIVATIHRHFNTNWAHLTEIIAALTEIAEQMPVVLPLHPRTRQALVECRLELPKKVQVVAPVGYIEMLSLLKGCCSVITDSGGLQKEAYMIGKKSLVLMSYTPWQELVDQGFAHSTDMAYDAIMQAYYKMQQAQPDFSTMLYGDGQAAQRIVERISQDSI